MSITSSTIVADQPFINGSRSVTERHVLNSGRVIEIHYVAAAGLDATAYMQTRVSFLEEQDADEAATRANFPILLSILAKLSAFNQAQTNLKLGLSVANGGANMTGPEIALYRLITS